MSSTYVEALELLQSISPLPTGVEVYITPSSAFPLYALTLEYCFVISVNGIMIYAIDTDEDKLKYFVGRAKQLARVI